MKLKQILCGASAPLIKQKRNVIATRIGRESAGRSWR